MIFHRSELPLGTIVIKCEQSQFRLYGGRRAKLLLDTCLNIVQTQIEKVEKKLKYTMVINICTHETLIFFNNK